MAADTTFFLPAQPKVKGGTILSSRYLADTALIWPCYFVGLFVPYLLYNWLPTMAKSTGYTSAQGAIMVGFLNRGGRPASVASGRLMDRFDRYRVSATSFCLAARSLRAVHGMQSTFRPQQVLAFAWGSFIPGAHAGMNAPTARFYPTVAHDGENYRASPSPATPSRRSMPLSRPRGVSPPRFGTTPAACGRPASAARAGFNACSTLARPPSSSGNCGIPRAKAGATAAASSAAIASRERRFIACLPVTAR